MKSEIEVFRILCMFGIVWFHSGVEVCRVVGHGGVFFFVIISVYFAATSRRRHSLAERTERLLLPCLVWSLFYGIISYVRRGHFFPEGYTLPSMLLATPSIHLWFLPFLFIVLTGIEYGRTILQSRAVALLAGVGAIVSLLFAPAWQEVRLADPFVQYLYSVPAILIGIFFSCFGLLNISLSRLITTAIVVSLLILTVVCHSEVGVLYLVGVLPCVFLFRSNMILGDSRLLLLISSSVYGIYLSHPFWQMVLRYVGVTSYILPLATFILSMSSILLLRRWLTPAVNRVKYILNQQMPSRGITGLAADHAQEDQSAAAENCACGDVQYVNNHEETVVPPPLAQNRPSRQPAMFDLSGWKGFSDPGAGLPGRWPEDP